MATLVTGAAGFIGSHLTERLAAEGRRVVCLDDFNNYYSPEIKRGNLSAALKRPNVQLYEGDIRDAGLCERVFKRESIGQVVHLAARAGVRLSLKDPLLYEDVNCRGTLVLLELARQHHVRKFVFGSSSSVYGNSRRIPFNEDDPVSEPISPYAATKRAGELYCYNYHHLYGLPIVCLRFFTVYGPRQRPDMAIHKFTRWIDEGRPVEMFGDGSMKRDYTFYSDIVDGVVAALDAKMDFEIVNLGDSRVVELRQLIGLIERALGKSAEIQQLPEQPGDVKITYADISKATRLLGYKPKFPIEKGVELFVEWYRTNCGPCKGK
ncbi:MAG: NAD-dependent epimerase/dehydratase family protein [Planctomycetes bacterium]|nr:NAD-dependent epimerase/dehydratase family protein [Planctomycetota bacterium]